LYSKEPHDSPLNLLMLGTVGPG